ncbi:uncharacterized protein LOC144129471 [Amblyomma americanum]
MRRRREHELLKYRSRHGLLDIDRIDIMLFKQQFRFEKGNVDDLVRALCMPERIVSAQRVVVPGRDALCLALRRLAYPNRWCDLQPIFGLHLSVMSSVASQVISHITCAPLPNCWAFIDGRARPICRPKRNQRAYFSGHKRVHCVKYKSLMCPNGIVCQLDGAYPKRRHDAGWPPMHT